MRIAQDYLETCIRRLKYYKDIAEKAMEQLEEKDFHWAPNEASNSIAIIIQHVAGNMLSRWTNFLTEDGEKEWRNRDDEFEIHTYNREHLMELWQRGWHCYFEALENLEKNDLKKTVHIRHEPLTVVDAINRQLAHYPYHIGQIVYIARMIRNDHWKNLSIPKGESHHYNQNAPVKDPAKNY
jgi:hypothetical protein